MCFFECEPVVLFWTFCVCSRTVFFRFLEPRARLKPCRLKSDLSFDKHHITRRQHMHDTYGMTCTWRIMRHMVHMRTMHANAQLHALACSHVLDDDSFHQVTCIPIDDRIARIDLVDGTRAYRPRTLHGKRLRY